MIFNCIDASFIHYNICIDNTPRVRDLINAWTPGKGAIKVYIVGQV